MNRNNIYTAFVSILLLGISTFSATGRRSASLPPLQSRPPLPPTPPTPPLPPFPPESRSSSLPPRLKENGTVIHQMTGATFYYTIANGRLTFIGPDRQIVAIPERDLPSTLGASSKNYCLGNYQYIALQNNGPSNFTLIKVDNVIAVLNEIIEELKDCLERNPFALDPPGSRKQSIDRYFNGEMELNELRFKFQITNNELLLTLKDRFHTIMKTYTKENNTSGNNRYLFDEKGSILYYTGELGHYELFKKKFDLVNHVLMDFTIDYRPLEYLFLKKATILKGKGFLFNIEELEGNNLRIEFIRSSDNKKLYFNSTKKQFYSSDPAHKIFLLRNISFRNIGGELQFEPGIELQPELAIVEYQGTMEPLITIYCNEMIMEGSDDQNNELYRLLNIIYSCFLQREPNLEEYLPILRRAATINPNSNFGYLLSTLEPLYEQLNKRSSENS